MNQTGHRMMLPLALVLAGGLLWGDAMRREAHAASPGAAGTAERDTQLCKALERCRRDFSRCKAAIEHPAQSGPWSRALDECGAGYKVCIRQHFQGGEWLFTRWFWPFDLHCGS